MNRLLRYLPLLFCISFARGQSAVEVNMGFGTVHDKASGTGINNITGASCTSGFNCVPTPDLSGFFMGFGGTIMLTKHFGFGGEGQIQPAKQPYAGLETRQIFWDINGVYAPVNKPKVALRLQGGLGGATSRFYVTSTACLGTAVCPSQTQHIGSGNHFQMHAGVGVQIYVYEHIFIRPQIDLHWVPNFTNQFGSNLAPGAMVFIGYSLGDR